LFNNQNELHSRV